MDAVVHPDPSTLRITTHEQYHSATVLTPSSVKPSPLLQFDEWFTAANDSGVKEPEAMSLSTCTRAGIPSSRIVLLKQVDARGFVFFTNYTSRKSRELTDSPHAALAFYWREVSRQVRVVGTAERVSRSESEAYFKSRPVGSRIGAWASRQSSVVGEGEVAQRVQDMKKQFHVSDEGSDVDIPLPDFWGGWRIVPKCVIVLVLRPG
jgi:pyridoxamine-phosphate oxidase